MSDISDSTPSKDQPRPKPPVMATLDAVWLILIAAGALLIIIAAVTTPLYVGISGHTVGKIIALPNDQPTIAYTVDGTEYTTANSEHGLGWTLGQAIPITYNPASPTQASTSSLRIWTIVFSSLGAALCAAGLIGTARVGWMYVMRRRVTTSGSRIPAEVIDVRQWIANVKTYATVLTCRWQSDDGATYAGKSMPLRLDRRVTVSELPTDTLPVYVDPTHPKHYYIDTSALVAAWKKRA
ncbi:MAG: hypothetical protein LBV06_06075 [Propionibacteriaceae bacterium]|jgi:hypothetical protein|nr:hypothetical protein [Propionibacteriaceae bacterium]